MLTHRTLIRTLLISCVALGATLTASTAASQATTERFTAFAINTNVAGGAATANVDIQITRWTPDAERERLTTILFEQGAAKMLEALKAAAAPRFDPHDRNDRLGLALRASNRPSRRRPAH